jgi:hypothetical protein
MFEIVFSPGIKICSSSSDGFRLRIAATAWHISYGIGSHQARNFLLKINGQEETKCKTGLAAGPVS